MTKIFSDEMVQIPYIIHINLFVSREPDLVAIALNPFIDVCFYFKQALSAYYSGTEFEICPALLDEPIQLHDLSIELSFDLSDEIIIRQLLAIRPEFREYAIKLIFRHYMDYPILDVLEKDSVNYMF